MRTRPVFAAVLMLSTVIVGCPELPEPVLCGTIPEGGCPAGRGGSCTDELCAALYDCVAGNWTRVEACDRADGGAPTDGGAGGAPPDAGPCTPVVIDTAGETIGCTPDLQEPDCPMEAAMGCAESVCLTGCSDFFLCAKGGWTSVAYCTDEGAIVVTQ